MVERAWRADRSHAEDEDMAVQQRVSVAEFEAWPDDGNRHELVRGEVRVMPPSKGRHGQVEAAIVAAIDHYLDDRARSMGWHPSQGLDARERLVGFTAVGEFGVQFTLPDDPNQVRGADGAYVPAAQAASVVWDEDEYFPAVPHLVIEVVSKTDRADAVEEKAQDYLAGGARRVWCVYPRQRTVHVRAADGPTTILRWGESLRDDALLPGFELPLSLIFIAPPDTAG